MDETEASLEEDRVEGSRQFDILVLTPAGKPNPSLAIAGSRAGAVGILNLEFCEDLAEANSALEQLARLGRGRRGVLLDGRDRSLLGAILSESSAGLSAILLAPADPAVLARSVADIHRAGFRAFVVVTSLAEARAAEAARADVLVAKGHEAGGWVGDETSFVLLQQLTKKIRLPILVQGGVGLHTAGACYLSGAAGIALDSQLLLTRESPLSAEARARVALMDGSETQYLGQSLGGGFRAYLRPETPVAIAIRRAEAAGLTSDLPAAEVDRQWRDEVRRRVDWNDPDRSLLAIGQDAAFASGLARRFATVGGVVQAIRSAIRANLATAQGEEPLAEGSPLAQSHQTRYPIVQGPMTRVSDRAEFAEAVAEAGALPFLALALMRGLEVRSLLDETRARLGPRSWGVGILGFVPAELRAEQLEIIREVRPPFALIAGGRPDQAKSLEDQGIPTYLHVPSPGLLRLFLQAGARRFVFEGRECGGHVGPRTSFVLWESMIDVLLEELPKGSASDCHVLFAGGIHDGWSAAMVSVLAAELVRRGVRIGVLMGTAYLFTEEAVRAGAIIPGFQQAALTCERTALLESGPGHATRCVPSPFCDDFDAEKRRLIREGLGSEEIRSRLEDLNVGRLRVASKGLDRHPAFGRDPGAPKLIEVPPDEQWSRGMYMIGQVATLRNAVCRMADLHRDVSVGCARHLAAVRLPEEREEPPPPAAVAIVGMACIVPGANDLTTFWSNILNKVDAVTEIPSDRFDWRRYFDPDKAARDKIYSRWGGFVGEVPFDPVEYGMPPGSLRSIEPFQLLTLATVRAALADAGYLQRPFARERSSVILGAGGGAGDLIAAYMTRSSLPTLFGDAATELVDRLDGILPEWTEDSFPGVLMNVTAGRVANRFDLGGVNYTIDAACASSLASVYQGVRELENRTSDLVIAGGVDAIENPFAFLAFSKTHALSPTGRCRTFDADADGIAISEGFTILVLKRLEDAERDGDRIYAVIRGVGGSSDGRDRSLTAPRPEGQVRALRRAYEQAGFSPATVGLIEAHGTGTVAGDQAEIQALSRFFDQSGALPQRCAIGSVKSMIGHTKAAAGVAGLIKVSLALYHQVLPPTLHVKRPNPKADFPSSPFYVNTESRPWLRGIDEHPRRAGVSAFGFGGTNFHVVVEEYTGAFLPEPRPATETWPVELFLWRATAREELLAATSALADQLDRGATPRLADLAYTLSRRVESADSSLSLAIVASSLADLRKKLDLAREAIGRGAERLHDPSGVHFATTPLAQRGKVAFLFPGQGSQYVGMGRDLAVMFPAARAVIEHADRSLGDLLPQPLSRYIWPPPAFGKEEERQRLRELTDTRIAQPALGAISASLRALLREIGVEPAMVAGHSYGEFAALYAAGAYGEEVLLRLAEARGRFINEGITSESGIMAAIEAGPDQLRPLVSDLEVALANMNAPKQTVLSGTRAGVEEAVARCQAQGISAHLLPVACAFHSPLMVGAQLRLAAFLRETPIELPRLPVYSNATGEPYPRDTEQLVSNLAEHLVRPVEFVQEIEAMYRDGARIFVEVGPKSVLTGLVNRILEGREFEAIALDHPTRPGLPMLLNGIAALAAEGVAIRADYLFEGRLVRLLTLASLAQDVARPPHSPTTWMVDGGRARPMSADGNPLDQVPLRIGPIESPGDSARPDPASESQAPSSIPPRVDPGPGPITAPYPGFPATRRGVAASPSAEIGPRDNSTKAGQPMGQVVIKPQPPGFAPDLVPPDSRPLPAGAGNGATEVVQRFQDVMQRFLETQQAVMLAYLRGAPAAYPLAVPTPRVNGDANGSHVAAVPAPVPSNETKVRPAIAPQKPVARPPAPTPAAVEPRPVEPIARPVPAGKAASNGAAPWDESTVQERLVGLVSERTGYPVEMLGLDADLEADLGIDSIKRVEIVTTLVRSLSLPADRQPDIEALTASRTLRQILENLAQVVRGGPTLVSAGAEGDQRPFEVAPAEGGVGRYRVRLNPAPPIEERAGLCREGIVLVTDDETGIARDLVDALSRRGCPALRINVGSVAGDGAVAADLRDAGSVERFVASLRQKDHTVSAIVHLAPLRPGVEGLGLNLGAWRERLAADLRGFFMLVQAFRADLERAAENGGAAVLAATRLGGGFASDGSEADFFPGHGGLTGFLKALATEWPAVRIKTVDLAAELPAPAFDLVLSELEAADGLVEVGYHRGERVTLQQSAAPLDLGGGKLPIDRDSVILVTGGARGITAEVAVRVAELAGPTLLLVGRTPLPTEPEPAETASLEGGTLKRAVLERFRAAGREVSPVQVEREYVRILHEREIRRNLARAESAGARVRYYTCDVRDPVAVSALIDEVYRDYGRIDGVVLGAGVIEDKLVRDKKLDSFDRVFGTKVESAINLASKLRPDTLRFVVFFSSIAGRIGNRGQADYGAANEVLNKLAIWLGKRWPGRVVAIDWGPWGTLGMATPEIQQQFEEKGIALVPLEAGCRYFLEELSAGPRHDNEVVVAGGPAVTGTRTAGIARAPLAPRLG